MLFLQSFICGLSSEAEGKDAKSVCKSDERVDTSSSGRRLEDTEIWNRGEEEEMWKSVLNMKHSSLFNSQPERETHSSSNVLRKPSKEAF